MSSEYKEVTEVVEIPKHAGIEGFLLAMRKILRLPKVVRGEFDARGTLTYTRYVREGEAPRSIEMDFDSVAPSNLVRNAEVLELDISAVQDNAAICLAAMFQAAAVDHLVPIAFVTGANTVFPDWHRRTTGVQMSGTIYGLPVHRDRFIPDEALLLVTAFTRDAGLIDVQQSYKIAMPSRQQPERPRVETTSAPVPTSNQGTIVAAGPPTDDDVKVLP